MKDLSLHIMDIVQNAISAQASLIEIGMNEDRVNNALVISVSDNGRGMDAALLQKVSDPYYTTRTSRKVGLGIPLLKHNAEQSGGSLIIESEPGKGTMLVATFVLDHIDRPAMGDVAGVLSLLTGANPDIEFVYSHQIDEREYVYDTRAVKEVLDDMPVNEPQVMKYLKEMIKENLAELNAGG